MIIYYIHNLDYDNYFGCLPMYVVFLKIYILQRRIKSNNLYKKGIIYEYYI